MHNTCSFFGHRKIKKTERLKSELKKVMLDNIKPVLHELRRTG